MSGSFAPWMVHVSPKETLSYSRMELVVATVLLTIAAALIQFSLPGLAVPFVASGLLLGVVSASNYVEASGAIKARSKAEKAESYARELRARMVQAEARKQYRDDVRMLFRSWADGKPTTKRVANDDFGIGQERWQAVVDLAVKSGLGVLVPVQGGNKTLKITATRQQLYQEASKV